MVEESVAEQDEDYQQQARLIDTMTLNEMLASERLDVHRIAGLRKEYQPHRMPQLHSSCDDSAEQTNTVGGKSQRGVRYRGELLHVNYVTEDIRRMAAEISDGTIAPVHLSLLGYWICEKPEHYDIAKTYIRELALDQGYNVERIVNNPLRKLLIDVQHVRPTAKQVSKNFEVASSLSSPTRNYPPNTPDRPEPLSVRSRTSGTSRMTPTMAHRALSSPISNATRPEPIPFSRNTILLEDTASHPLLASSEVSENAAVSDDVFGIVKGKSLRLSKSLVNIRSLDEGENVTSRRTYASTNQRDEQPFRRFELYSCGLSSRISYNSLQSIVIGESASDNERAESDQTICSDVSEPMVEYATSNESSFLDLVSIINIDSSQALIKHATASPAGPRVKHRPASLTYGCRFSDLARRLVMKDSPDAGTVTFHRPLPLRSYESEVRLFPTARTGGMSNHNHTQSARSILRSSRPPSLPVEPVPRYTPVQSVRLPIRMSPTEIQESRSSLRSTINTRRAHHTDMNQLSESDEHDIFLESFSGDSPRATSFATTLLNFPIPPMQNPLGALPMLVARTTTTHPVASLAEACRAIAFQTHHIRNLLEQTRTRGEHLPRTEWSTMPAFERAWRDLNEELLISIYGRCDIELHDDDVQYIDCIARELRESPEAHWVLELFREEGYEMF